MNKTTIVLILSCCLHLGLAQARIHPRIHQQGIASWYGPGFHHHLTANGERYNMYGLSAASRTIPLGTMITVTLLKTGKKVRLKVNDRGPYVHGRILDLSYGAAKKLGIVQQGTARVRIDS